MPKQTLTPDGVIAKQTELYALSDTALLPQVRTLIANPVLWLDDNFILSAGQISYLNLLSPLQLLNMGSLLGAAISGRKPIAMSEPPPPPLDDQEKPKRTKQLIFWSNDDCRIAPANPEVGGDFTLKIGFYIP